MRRVIDVLAQITVRVIDLLALLGYRCLGTCQVASRLPPTRFSKVAQVLSGYLLTV